MHWHAVMNAVFLRRSTGGNFGLHANASVFKA
jgi:hypothetical protein